MEEEFNITLGEKDKKIADLNDEQKARLEEIVEKLNKLLTNIKVLAPQLECQDPVDKAILDRIMEVNDKEDNLQMIYK